MCRLGRPQRSYLRVGVVVNARHVVQVDVLVEGALELLIRQIPRHLATYGFISRLNCEYRLFSSVVRTFEFFSVNFFCIDNLIIFPHI